MSTTAVSAGQIMDRVANLLNDPNKTDYTYTVVKPYLNMAIEELSESMEESNNSPSNQTSAPITIPLGMSAIYPAEDTTPGVPHYSDNLVEVQEVGERASGSSDAFRKLERREFLQVAPANQSLLYWIWEDQKIKFNPSGALGNREVQLKYVAQGLPYVLTENDIITMIHSRAYLSYKTAALCALFIGENESRAEVLDNLAERAIERTNAIGNKGRQQIMTRHRPFRASYKMRGWL